MKDKNRLLSQPHMVELVKFVNRLRERYKPAGYVPNFDPEDGGCEAEILFLFEKPGPGTNPARKPRPGSGFISQDNEDRTAPATKELLSKVFKNTWADRKNIAIWNAIPAWNGTIEITPKERQENKVEEFQELLSILDKVRLIILVGKEAEKIVEKIKKQIDLSAYQVSRSPHPSRKNSEDLEKIRIIWQEVISGLEGTTNPMSTIDIKEME